MIFLGICQHMVDGGETAVGGSCATYWIDFCCGMLDEVACAVFRESGSRDGKLAEKTLNSATGSRHTASQLAQQMCETVAAVIWYLRHSVIAFASESLGHATVKARTIVIAQSRRLRKRKFVFSYSADQLATKLTLVAPPLCPTSLAPWRFM